MGEGRCWTCPTVRWTQRNAACWKSWSGCSHSRSVSWPSEHTPSQQPAPWRRFPCGLRDTPPSLRQSPSPSSLPDLLGHPGGGRAVSHASVTDGAWRSRTRRSPSMETSTRLARSKSEHCCLAASTQALTSDWKLERHMALMLFLDVTRHSRGVGFVTASVQMTALWSDTSG